MRKDEKIISHLSFVFCRKLLINRQNFLFFTIGKKCKRCYDKEDKTKEEKFEP